MKKMQGLINPTKFPFYYGYLILVFGTIGILASIPGQTIGISTFTDPLKDALGLNRNQISLAYMLGTLASSLILTKAGKLYDRLGAMHTASYAIALLMGTLILCSFSIQISNGVSQIIHSKSWAIPFSLMIVLFFLLRFSGQGVLTMVSRNMVMKWFDRLRGRINAISSISVSFGFSISPLLIDQLIQGYTWQGAWQIIAGLLLIILAFVVLFYKDNPEKYDLHIDGKVPKTVSSQEKTKAEVNFTLSEALQTRSFWMYSLILSFQAFFITGFTFHVVSVFSNDGYTRDEGIAIFLPITIISTIVSIVGNFISDWIKLKILLFSMISGAFLASLGLFLLENDFGYYLLIIGFGICSGLFAVLMAIVWPRLYGRQHLGAISGKAMSMLVMASAIGPYLYSNVYQITGSYGSVSIIAFIYLTFLAIGSLKANVPLKH